MHPYWYIVFAVIGLFIFIELIVNLVRQRRRKASYNSRTERSIRMLEKQRERSSDKKEEKSEEKAKPEKKSSKKEKVKSKKDDDAKAKELLRKKYSSFVAPPSDSTQSPPHPSKADTLVLSNQKEIERQRRFTEIARKRVAEQDKLYIEEKRREEAEYKKRLEEKRKKDRELYLSGESVFEDSKTNSDEACSTFGPLTNTSSSSSSSSVQNTLDISPVPLSKEWSDTKFATQVTQQLQFYMKILSLHEEKPTQEAAREFCLEIMPELKKYGIKKETRPTTPPPFSILPTLCLRFKQTFFFVPFENIPCPRCGNKTITKSAVDIPNAIRRGEIPEWWMCSRAQRLYCPYCSEESTFYRVNHPLRILQERKGRCGEYANVFTLLCNSLGYKSRIVLDISPEVGDHVWTEVYDEKGEFNEEMKKDLADIIEEKEREWMKKNGIEEEKKKKKEKKAKTASSPRFICFDSCEGFTDNPLVYEQGWGKTISRVIGVSKRGFYDVTQRYSVRNVVPLPTKDYNNNNNNNNNNTDDNYDVSALTWLSSLLSQINKILFASLPALEKGSVIKRRAEEMKEIRTTHLKTIERIGGWRKRKEGKKEGEEGESGEEDEQGLRNEEMLPRLSGN